jgi:phosphatidylinositol alpha-1,6-mannosyltransferase
LLLLVGPYFKPTYYGGVVQVYHQLLTGLRSLDRVIVSQRLCGDPAQMEEFDRSSDGKYGYGTLRISRFDLIFRPGAKLWERMLDTVRFFLTTRSEWRRVVREVKPDVIVCGATLAAGWLMGQIPESIPFINYLHGEELGSGEGGSRYVQPYLFERQLDAIRRANLNISVSRYTANKAAQLAGIDSGSIVLLPNFVDINRFFPPANRDELRRELGWHGRKIILSLARLTPRKGIDQAVRALAELRRADKLSPEWLHVIAGRGEQEAELRALVNQLGVNDYTRFEGFIDHERVPQYYGASDIFLQPNRDLAGDTEGFGVVFLEANACGTPVVGGIAGGTADAIREGVTGFRVDGEDVPAIGRALLQLADDHGLRQRMGQAGREVVLREHRVEAGVAKFEELVQQVIKKRARTVRGL